MMTSETAKDSDIDVDWIMAELDAGTHHLPEEAIRAARRNRELIIPRLIQSIQDATKRVAAGEALSGDSHFFSLFLLTEFEVREALPAILDAISLPDDLPFELFGDAVTTSLAPAVVALAADPLDCIDSLITNRSLNEYVRWEAAQAFLFLVRDGQLTREDAVERLCHYLKEAVANQDVELASGVVSELVSYSPSEVIGEIEEAYRADVVDESIVSLTDVEQSIAEGDSRFRRELENCPATGIADTIEELRRWASFQEEPESPPPPSFGWTSDYVGEEKRPRIEDPAPPVTVRNTLPRVGRNAPCPCGSGKKYKKCCGSS